MRQTVGSDTTNYLWDELSAYGDVVRETNGTGTELASYTLAGSQLLGQTRSGVTSYYLSDGQGSTRALLNGTGDITDTYAYTAFGEIYNQTGSTLNNYLYTGQQFDSLTGLYSLRARYYDPGVGRFVSRDTYPINYRNPIELNRYGYVGNNPINASDPTGFMSFKEWAYTSYTAAYVAVASLNPLTCTIVDIIIEVLVEMWSGADLGETGFELPCTHDGGANQDDADAPCRRCLDDPDFDPPWGKDKNGSGDGGNGNTHNSNGNDGSDGNSTEGSDGSTTDGQDGNSTEGSDGSTTDGQDGNNGSGGSGNNTPPLGDMEFPNFSKEMRDGLAVLKQNAPEYYEILRSNRLTLVEADTPRVSAGMLIGRTVAATADEKFPASTATTLYEEVFHAHQGYGNLLDIEIEAHIATARWVEANGLVSQLRGSADYRILTYLSDVAESGEAFARDRLTKNIISDYPGITGKVWGPGPLYGE